MPKLYRTLIRIENLNLDTVVPSWEPLRYVKFPDFLKTPEFLERVHNHFANSEESYRFYMKLALNEETEEELFRYGRFSD